MAKYHSKLSDISTSTEYGTITTNVTKREIITDLTGTAVGSSKQTVEKFKALQTDKVQSIGAASASQQGDTNIVQSLEKLVLILKALEAIKTP